MRTVLSLLVILVALPCAALEGEAASRLQRLLGDATKVPHPADIANLLVRDFGQTAWALILSGEMTVARNLVELGLGAVKSSGQTGRPAGALPPTLHADGTTRDPRFMADAQAVASLLEAALRYAEALPGTSRKTWLDQWWNEISLASTFVIGWTRGARGAPFPAYDPRFGRDVGGARESMGALLATMCAQRLAEMADRSVPETWQQRRDALEALVRTTDFSDNGRAIVNLPWGCRHLRGILPEQHPLWNFHIGETTVRERAWRSAASNEPEQVLIGLLTQPPATP